MKILGIETSCDETAAAIVDNKRVIHANLVLSQLDDHKAFGGVVPEIAARAHLDHLDTLIRGAMDEAGLRFNELDGVAATSGPGLIGGVMVGMMAGKAIAAAHNLPFMGINHLEAHALTPRLTDNVQFPYLILLVSGGHTQILVAEDVGVYKRWGTTIDDALGECFDKSAKLMGLGYPGGPNLEKIALTCTDHAGAIERFPLPKPLKGRDGCDFSFSGLKTAVRNHIEKLPQGDLNKTDIADLAYAFQITVTEIIEDRCTKAITRFLREYKNSFPHTYPQSEQTGDTPQKPAFVVSGGVAANISIREKLKDLTAAHNMDFMAPPLHLCSDNAAMIAWTGIERLQRNMTDSLDIGARPRWPLDPTAEPKIGGGVKA
ncbi:MAG: tRNA (adenosine(37)-N6)-threonylcarbamoyltransferase complex transferase subunit TsaD [Alphaproteobacteria bacterium]|nr:tRNA (adenosine(37)-N6)-threonylcarbamoyltransferase complex transferase subunit TsaD [Alphaproteobacteria bacterium]NCQ89251.1 tRNA (adenosine(37)-N6)-threonylcarbamoyltransferase complex transferase subunit TsaD [Alphaproteobacteria bacterium]NCT08390.1 tRNA (adenosine(37)-N6)-threonylcarbamoyltransferase complex transferase subunit TsaD [Alphaproteobacteria bacterium]